MNKINILILVLFIPGLYMLWEFMMPVEIVAVHRGDIILVKNFPYLKARQIAWWEGNKEMIQAKYGIPHKLSDGYYNVSIQDFGDGYRIDQETDEDSDLLCFEDMPLDANCIKKSPLLLIGWSKNTGMTYESFDRF